MDMIEIDGSMGEGGGQILRTALTLSLCTGQPVAVTNIRAGRRKPGLLRQHLAALRAAKAINGAEVMGDELGSSRIEFVPNENRAGHYQFAIGSAGSTTLLLQSVLPALALLDTASTIELEGGTHNGMAPSVDFMEQVFMPALARLGIQVQSTLIRHGFYPNGGGCWQVKVAPWTTAERLSFLERGPVQAHRAVAKVSNLRASIAERELARIVRKLGFAGDEIAVETVDSPGPGNILVLVYEYGGFCELFDAVGALGVSAEQVAGRAIRDAKRYLQGSYPVGEYLADQLLVPMVLGDGGEFLTGELSDHTKTNIKVIERVLGRALVDVHEQTDAQGTVQTLIKVPQGLALAR